MSMPHYDRCPKCNHAPLPANQSLPAECPACGIVLAKFHSDDGDARRAAAVVMNEQVPDRSISQRLLDAMFFVPQPIAPIGFWSRVVLLALFALWGLRLIALDYETGGMMSSFLHGPLLIFHEAGHVIFSFFGEFITVLGGSLAQLLMPAIMAGALLIKNRDPFGAAIAAWLFGVSLLDLAPYVYDALEPQLVLLGGHTGEEGGHDWIYLLSAVGLLERAHGLGWLVHKSGALTVTGSLAWATWLLRQQYRRGLRVDI